MEFTTQMDAARRGLITPQMEAVAAKERIDVETLRQQLANGTAIIPANKNHKALDPNGIGSKLRTKINVNLGTSATGPIRTWNTKRYRQRLIWALKRLWT